MTAILGRIDKGECIAFFQANAYTKRGVRPCCIVDGIGSLFDTEYGVSMAGSHCTVLHQLNKPKSFYYRGPDLWSAIKTTGGIAHTQLKAVSHEELPPALLAPGQRQAPSPIFSRRPYPRW